MASLGGRFTGNPLKPEPSHPDVTAESDPQAIVTKLRGAIKAEPERWESYWALGTLLVESAGDYTEANRVFLSYPGFNDPSLNDPVALSNYAYDAGSMFFHVGEFQLAKPFYTVAAELDTGSGASMVSKVRLELIANDYPRAISDLFATGSRYSDAYAYSDYLSFLHAFGQHDAAWRAFAQLDASFNLPEVWVSALVGHRMAGTEGREIGEWLHRPEIRDARFRAQQFAPYFAVLWYATDRDPPPELGKLVEELQGPPVGHIDVDGVTLLVPHPIDPEGLMSVSGSPFRAARRSKLPPDTPIKSDLAYFADAYAALRAGNYAAAVGRFDAMADHYPIEGYPLGYFAYAAAKSGDKEQLEKYLDTLKADPGFDYWLARAYFAGIGKDAQGARDALQRAVRKRPSTDYRPIMSEYQYAEACEWLYQETQDPRLVSDLLSWVRGIQVSQPTQAWPYAMEYSHTPQGPARARALAMTRYLDPKSKRIRNASRDELRAADAWFRDNNPFRIPAHSSKTAGTPIRSPDSHMLEYNRRRLHADKGLDLRRQFQGVCADGA
jgi:tetratricopeptide (TPR) repeat protein